MVKSQMPEGQGRRPADAVTVAVNSASEDVVIGSKRGKGSDGGFRGRLVVVNTAGQNRVLDALGCKPCHHHQKGQQPLQQGKGEVNHLRPCAGPVA